MAKKDYNAIAQAVLANVGGEGNVTRVSHCMTRLRIQVADASKVDVEAAKKITGVLNMIVNNGEYQYVIGQDVADAYEAFNKLGNFNTAGAIDDAEALKADAQTKGSVVNQILAFIGGTFSPVIPVLVAGGLTGAVLTLLTTFFGVSAESGTYQVLYGLNQATFYFLPIFIGFSAATKLNSNGFLGAFLGAILLYPSINGAEGLSFFGIPITAVGYNSTVFPVILGVLFMSVVYKFFRKHLPVVLRTIFVPLLTMLITVPVTLIALGPIGGWAGTLLANSVFAIYRAVPPIAVMLIGCLTPWMVFFGMNNATYPIVFALLAEVGSDPLICAGMAPANVAVGGACLAIALKSKDLELKSVGLSSGITALCGITEPGVYGVLFPKKTPLIGAMIGGGLGGLVCGILGMTQYVISTPGFISLPAYINPDGSPQNLIYALVVMILAVAVSFGATWVLYKEEK